MFFRGGIDSTVNQNLIMVIMTKGCCNQVKGITQFNLLKKQSQFLYQVSSHSHPNNTVACLVIIQYRSK